MSLTMTPPIHRKRMRVADALEPQTEGKPLALMPDWRWKRAKHALEHVRKAVRYEARRGRDCPIFVQQVLPFCEAQRDAKSYHDFLALEDRYPAAWWAKRMAYDKPEEATRWLIEALVCADLPAEEIGQRLGVPASYIWWYEKMFFDIRDYVDNTMTMIAKVFRASALKHPKVEDLLWKAVAWKHGLGADGLEALANPMATLPDNASNALYHMIAKQMTVDALMAQAVRQINAYNSNFVLDQYQRMVEKGKDEDGVGGTSPVESGMKVFLEYYAHHLGVAKYETEFRGVEMGGADAPGSELFQKRREEKAAATSADEKNAQGGQPNTGDTK